MLFCLAISLSLSMGTSCTTNEDCLSTPESGGWGCCSGFGFCVGPGSGWSCTGLILGLGAPGACEKDSDCPQLDGNGEKRCCGVWGWCTNKCN